MDRQSIKDKVIAYAKSIGIDKIGFASSQPFDDLRESLIEQKAKGHTTGFEHPIIEERLYPDRILPGAQSIISIGLAYPSRIRQDVPKDKLNKRGQFARASWGLDYHHVLRNKLQQLDQFLKELCPQAQTEMMVDTGALIDVAVAARAGLGFIGRNGLLISKEFGSWLYLGEMITNINFEPDTEVAYDCGQCFRCIRACPTQALLGDGRMNAQKCLSYQTQTKSIMPEDYRRKISSVIYGCDICQLVCPYNQGIDYHLHEEMEPIVDQVQPQLKPLLTLSNREFKAQFGHLAGSWRGKKPIQRNAIIALANMGDKSAMPELIRVMEDDPRPDIRAIAAWALSQIEKFYNPVLLEAVIAQADSETDSAALTEFDQAIQHLKQKRPARTTHRKRDDLS